MSNNTAKQHSEFSTTLDKLSSTIIFRAYFQALTYYE